MSDNSNHLSSSSIPSENVHSLKKSGLKATLPRLHILKLFENSNARHLTAEDVYNQLLQDNIDVGIATVYRVLTQFEQAGLLAKHYFEGGKSVFELNQGEHHDHVVCLKCGHVEEFINPEIEQLQEKITKERGFKLKAHSLYLYVDCERQDCVYACGQVGD